MSDKVSRLPVKPRFTYLVFVPNERNPTFVDASQFITIPNQDGSALLQLMHHGNVVAVFNHWDYFECASGDSEEGAA